MQNLKPLFQNKSPQRILVITMRYLGDTLLITPLLNSLKTAYPLAEIDVLLYENTAAILAGNPTITQLITTPAKMRWQDHLRLIKKVFRQYDLAIATQTGDKLALYAFFAAKTRIGFVPTKQQTGWFKRYLYTRWLEFDTQKTHTVLEILKLCQLLAIQPLYQLTAPLDSNFKDEMWMNLPYAVLHILPQWRYKQWTESGWIAIAHYLNQQGLRIVLSGSAIEKEYLDKVLLDFPEGTLNIAGQFSLAQLAHIIKQAKLFIGVDTGITHLATATGVPTIALLGPSDPVKWTPWPFNYNSDMPPFVTKGNQQINNVFLIQGVGDCVPCYLEGCERHQQSYSRCLEMLSPESVKMAISTILNSSTIGLSLQK